MNTYEGSIYDPDTLHKYMYANGNPVTYSDPSGNSSIGGFVASTICTIMNHAYEINLLGVLSGITNAAITGLLGGSDMDITKAFIGGYLFGIAAGIGAVLLTTAVTNALLLARFYVITATAGAAMSVGAAIYAIMTNNKKAAIVYGVLAVLSIFNMAEAYNYYCQVWLIGEKGIAAFSTADFSVSKGMSESDVGSRIFTSKDPLVGELATQIEKEVPGKVIAVNKKVYRDDGSVLTDLDIELDNIVIQVKSGGEKMKSVILISPSENEIKNLYQQWKDLGSNIYFDYSTFDMLLEGEGIYIDCLHNGNIHYDDDELTKIGIDIPYFYGIDYSNKEVMFRFLSESIFAKGSFLDNDLGQIESVTKLQREGLMSFIE